MVGQQTLNLPTVVRIHSPQPEEQSVAHSSRGLGHRPLKAEIRGSNPLCATNNRQVVSFDYISRKTYNSSHY